MNSRVDNLAFFERIHEINQKLSDRFIALDPGGYFLIRLDESKGELVVEHFTNDIDDSGKALDPETGEPLACADAPHRRPNAVYRAFTAKQMGIKLTEGQEPFLLSKLDHALYLGRELQRAETCLVSGLPYVQD